MGLFQSLFGIQDKEDIGAQFPNPPSFNLAPGSANQQIAGIQQLIDVFQKRSQGQDQFDFIKFLFEPQLARLNQNFGIDSQGDGSLGPLGKRQGAFGRLESTLQKRGLFDTGSAGVLQAQLESDRNRQESELFGQAKELQRADIDASLQSLGNLFPALFSAQNVENVVDFENSIRQHDAESQRNIATIQQRQQRASQKTKAIQSGLGLALAPFTGGLSAAGGFGGGASSGLFNLFGGGGVTQPRSPLSSSPGFRNLPLGVNSQNARASGLFI